MAYTVQFETGQIVEFDQPPTPQDIEEVAASFAPKKPEGLLASIGDVLEAPVSGIARGAANIWHGMQNMRAMNQAAVPIPEAQDLADNIRRQADIQHKEALKQIEGYAPDTFLGKVVSGVSTMGTTLAGGPATMIPGTLGAGLGEQRNLMKQGVDPSTAAKAAGTQTAANAVSMLIPALSFLKNVGVNVGTGVVLDEATAQLLSEYNEAQKAYRPMSEDYWVNRAVEIFASYAFRAKQTDLPTDKTKPPLADNRKAVLDAADAPKTSPESPEQIEFFRQRALQMQKEAQDTPIQMTPEGQMVPPDLTAATRSIDEQQVTAPQYGQGINPEANRQAAALDMRLKMLQEAGFSEPPRDTGIVQGSDQTPLSGMARDMDTIDFQLRQEVLDSETGRQFTDAWAERIMQLEEAYRRNPNRVDEKGETIWTPEGRALQEGLDERRRAYQQFGMAEPRDATTRGLYEGGNRVRSDQHGPPLPGRYLETGIQRTGDRNTSLATMPETKQLPLGGKQPTPEETSKVRSALSAWKKWRDENAKRGLGGRGKQSGHIDRSLLGLGAIDKLISKFGDLGALTKFKGTFDFADLKKVLEELKANPNARLTWMTPDQFHELAADRNDKYFGDYGQQSEAKRASISSALDTETGLKGHPRGTTFSIPTLWVKPMMEGYAKVQGHDGRHRMDVMKKRGVEKVPVIIFDDGRTRFNYEKIIDQGDKAIFRDFPKSMDLPLDQLPGERPKFIPKDMRGAIHPKEIIDGINGILEKFKKAPKSEEQAKSDARSRIPGLPEVSMVTPDPVMTPELKQTFLTEGDSSNVVSRALAPGRIALQELQGKTNQLIAFVGRHMENARNRYEINKDRFVEPVKRALQPVMRSRASMEALTDVFFKELKRGSRYDENTLKSVLKPSELEAYNTLRSSFDETIKRINEIRKLKGQKEITPMDAYIASTWLGPWKAKVYDSNNNLVWVIAEPSRRLRTKAMKFLESKDPTLKFADVQYDSHGTRRSDGLQAGYDELLTLLGKDNLVTQTVHELLASRYLGETVNIAGVEQHFKKKTGVKGFAGDRPWVDSFEDQRAMFAQQVRYMDGVLRWYEHQKAIAKVDPVLKDPEIRKARKGDVIYLEEFINFERGYGTNEVVSKAEDAILKALGVSPKHQAEALSVMKSIFYMTKLGFSVPFMTVSFIQPYLSVPPALLAHKGNFGRGLEGLLLDGYVMAVDLVGHDIASIKGVSGAGEFIKALSEHKLSDLSVEAIDYARANRVAELNQLSDVRDVEASPTREMIEKIGGASITMPEMVARSQAYMAFVHGLKHKYDTSTREGRLALFEKAAEITKEAMADYNPAQKAAIYQRLGAFGNAASALQTFMMNHAYQTYKYAKMAKNGDPKPFLTQLALQLTVAGAAGLIGVEDAEDLWQNIKSILPHDAYVAVKDVSIKKAMVESMGEWMAYGPASKITGTSVYPRFSTADMLKIPPFEASVGNSINGFLPFIYDTMFQQLPALLKLASPTSSSTDRKEAFHTLLPSALKGPNENENMRGDIVPRMGQMEYGSVRRTERGKELRKWGFKELREQIQQDELYAEKAQNAQNTERIKGVRDDFVRGVVANRTSEITRALKKAVDLGYNPSSWMSTASMDRVVMNAFLPIIEREMIKLSKRKDLSPKDAERLKIWSDLYQRTK